MPLPVKLLLFYLAGISLVSAAVTIADKRKARQHKWRIPEATLLLLATLGGSAAMYITMHCIRHQNTESQIPDRHSSHPGAAACRCGCRRAGPPDRLSAARKN